MMDPTKIAGNTKEELRDKYVPLLCDICGKQTSSQIWQRVLHNEDAFYKWLENTPSANKDDIRKKSHEIAGTVYEYEATVGKRFYVIAAYKDDVIRMSGSGQSTFVNKMILSSNLMLSALEIADDMPLYANHKNVYIGERINYFVDRLGQHGIVWENDDMLSADVSNMGAEDIVALIVCTTWRNRLFPGKIKIYLQKGVLIKWLERLDELDK